MRDDIDFSTGVLTVAGRGAGCFKDVLADFGGILVLRVGVATGREEFVDVERVERLVGAVLGAIDGFANDFGVDMAGTFTTDADAFGSADRTGVVRGVETAVEVFLIVEDTGVLLFEEDDSGAFLVGVAKAFFELDEIGIGTCFCDEVLSVLILSNREGVEYLVGIEGTPSLAEDARPADPGAELLLKRLIKAEEDTLRFTALLLLLLIAVAAERWTGLGAVE